MKFPRFTKARTISALVVTLLVCAVSPTAHVKAQESAPASSATSSKLNEQLIGTWILVGRPGQIVEAPAAGGRLQFFTGKHWLITQADPQTGKVIFHHGGTYTLDGEQMAKTVEYANENTADLIKETHKFEIKVDGDTMTQTGIGNPWTEVWKRLK